MLNIQELKKYINSINHDDDKLNILFKNHVSSTNDYLNYKYARDLFPLLVVANNQRAARGRGNKKWISLNKFSLSFSLCLRLDSRNFDLRYLSYLSCVSLHKAIKNVSDDVLKIKWPNDLYKDNRKVSGILIESLSKSNDLHVAVGVGININIPSCYHIDQPYSNLSRNINYEKLIYYFCRNIVTNLDSIDKTKILNEFNKNLFWYKKRVEIKNNNDIFNGVLLGIDDSGELILENSEKIIRINNINSTMRLL